MEARIGGQALAADARERILRAAGGNPLFVEEMAAMVQASGDGEVDVPPTLQALIAARLDQLEAPERSVLERGAVEGEVFHHGVVQALTARGSRLTSQLTALVRKELIRPDRPLFAGEDAFRFRHLLDARRGLRRAAEGGARGSARAVRRLARTPRQPSWSSSTSWSGTTSSGRYRYRQELGQTTSRACPCDPANDLGTLQARPVLREDFEAMLNLLERAADVAARRATRRTVRDRAEVRAASRRASARSEAVMSGLADAAARFAAAGHRARRARPAAGPCRLLGPLRTDRKRCDETREPRGRVHARIRGSRRRIRARHGLHELAPSSSSNSRALAAPMSPPQQSVSSSMRDGRTPNSIVDWGHNAQLVQCALRGRHAGGGVSSLARRAPGGGTATRAPLRRDRLLAMLGRFDEANGLLARAADRLSSAELG